MQNEQTPAAGPLNAESVALLKKGDLLRALETTCAFCEGEILTFEGPGTAGECMVFGMSWMAKRFTFLGRPDQDGWIAWHGGENPVGNLRVDIVTTVQGHNNVPAHEWNWNAVKKWRPYSAEQHRAEADETERRFKSWFHVPSPASSSSVVLGDASGVEREQIKRAIADGFSNGYEQYDEADPTVQTRFDMAADAVLKLRPQPSGETRRFSVDDLAQEIRRVDGNHSLGAGALAEALMPFLIRPAPVASSDQPEQGGEVEVVTWRWALQQWDGLSVWYHSTTKPRQKATERIFNLQGLNPAEPAEARVRVRELEARIDQLGATVRVATDNTCNYFNRATAAEAKLAKAKEALEAAAVRFDEIYEAAEVDDIAYRNEATIHGINSNADVAQAEVRQTLAALQQEGG